MSKIAHYLQEHLLGEVMSSPEARRHFSTDASVFSVAPTVVVFPRSEQDVRKAARFCWQLAERGRIVPITARGSGTDLSGAAIGSGIIMVFPAHMNQILELDNKQGRVIVQPGLNYGKLQQTLKTHGRFLPPYPASLEYSTIGGAVANNAGGEKSFKYGDTREFVTGLRVVLANGEVIDTERLNKHELNKKLGLTTFEGELYRAVDTLLEENAGLLAALDKSVTKNSSGYALNEVRTKDGFDLTPLFVGSQGTLGLITEIYLDSESHNPLTTLVVGLFDNPDKLQQSLHEIVRMKHKPSSVELVDQNLLAAVAKINPNQLRDVIAEPYPAYLLLVEFDNDSERDQKHAVKATVKVFEQFATASQVAEDETEQTQLRKLRESVSSLFSFVENNQRAVPAMDDGIVPLDRFSECLQGISDILKRNHVRTGLWGHAGDGNLHLMPHLDLSQVGDRQRLFRLNDEYYQLVGSLGGSLSGEFGDGRSRGPYLEKIYGTEVCGLFSKLKQIFDPYAILNPGVKVGVNPDELKARLRQGYDLSAWYEYLPRT